MDSRQGDSSAPSPEAAAISVEQARVSVMYERLDALRAQTRQRLSDAHLQERAGYAAIVERETRSYEYDRRRAQLGSVEEGLCFGRIDVSHGPGDTEARYVGRIGLRDTAHETILVDWRAPAARPFYAATPGDPEGITRRRHLRVRRRQVVGLDDEVFDADGLTEGDRRQLVGEAALLASLQRGRTGRMADIVATIQAEQDRVIRARLAGVLVVQGGPGTGKTVAALHRAAYLLYTHRRVLERRGVLVVGPNPAFLRYVGDVLPSLGETDVVMRTVGELLPGVEATAHDRPDVAVLKGSPSMVKLVREAIRDRQRTPRQAFGEAPLPAEAVVSADTGAHTDPRQLGNRAGRPRTAVDSNASVAQSGVGAHTDADADALVVEADAGLLVVPADVCAHILETTRNLRLPHNTARKYLVNTLLAELARAESRLLGRPVAEEDLPHLGARLWQEEPVQQALDALWPDLTPQRLLRELYADPEALARIGARARVPEAASLTRTGTAPWTVEDVPLLDEAAEILGRDDSRQRARRRRADAEREEEIRYAQGVLDFTGLTEEERHGLDAVTLAARHRDSGPDLTTADRAGADRTWTYGHVIVDEAQELSPMAWRTVMRRVPTRSLTVVGDVAQTGSAAGTDSWQAALERYAPGKVHVEHLRVNYRTPAPIMAVAADVLREAAPDQTIPESVREEGDPPRAVRLTGLGDLPALVAEERAAVGPGRIAVVTSDASLPEVAAALPGTVRPGSRSGDAPGDAVVVLTATESKGLEFDSVIVVRPEELLAQPRGANDLYVAVTRATKRLTVAHDADLPALLKRLAD